METKEQLDLNKIKQESVHTGMLEALIHLHQSYNEINDLMKDEDLKCWSRKLGEMSDTLCDFATDIGEMIGLSFAVKIDKLINNQTELSDK